MEIINKTEKAAFEARAYSSVNTLTGAASGFFLSADGLAITMGYIFEHADSAVIKTRNGRTYQVEHIISVHPQSNLALIKVAQRQKPFHYLLPSKRSFLQDEDLLFFTHPNETEGGISIKAVNDIIFFPYISRTGILENNCNYKSAGAPAINSEGELCGILNVSSNGQLKILYNTYILNDSNWINTNIYLRSANYSSSKKEYLNPSVCQSIINIVSKQYVQSAKILSKYLKTHPNDDIAYCLRSYARYYYQNTTGCKEDIETCSNINPNNFLQLYFKGLFNLNEPELDEAKTNFELCINKKNDFALAITQLAIINFQKDNDVKEAFRLYSLAIEFDSLEANAYYERARLRLQYSDDQEATMDDINKTIYLDPDMPGIYTIRGVIKFSEQNFLSAINDFDKAIEKDINDMHAYFNRGVAHYNIGLHQKACEDWTKAGKLGKYEAYRYISRYCKNVKRSIYIN